MNLANGPSIMHTEKTIEAAKRLESKLLGTSTPLAVFALCGHYVITRVTTESFKNQVRLTPERLVGVYTADCPVEDIAADFKEAGIL